MSKLSPAEHTSLVCEVHRVPRALVEAGLGEAVTSALGPETMVRLGGVGMRDLAAAELGRARALPDELQILVVGNAARMDLLANRNSVDPGQRT